MKATENNFGFMEQNHSISLWIVGMSRTFWICVIYLEVLHYKTIRQNGIKNRF